MVAQISNFINNTFVQTESKIDSFNPSNGVLLCSMPDSGKTEADMAVSAASSAFKTWSVTSASYRANIMNKIGK